MKKIIILGLIAMLSACGYSKKYKPDATKINKKSQIMIDGSKSRGSGFIFGSSKASNVFVYEKQSDCDYHYLGFFKSKGGSDSKKFLVDADKHYMVLFERTYTTTSTSMNMTTTHVRSNENFFFLHPKPDAIYKMRFNDEKKKLTDFNVIEVHKDKESEMKLEDMTKTSCKELKIKDPARKNKKKGEWTIPLGK